MKFFILFILFILSFETNILKAKDVLESGVFEIIEKYYQNKNEGFDIVIVGSETQKLLEIVNNFAAKIIVPFEIKTLKKSENQQKIIKSAIILIDTLASYHNLYHYTVLGNSYPRNFYFIIFIDEFYQIEDVITINDTKNPFRTTIFSQASFLKQDNINSLTLTTFLTFQQPNCRQWKAVQINQFSYKKWKNDNFFVPKFTNFNRCMVIIRVLHPQPLIVNATFHENGVLDRVYGCAAVINEIVSQYLNYSFTFNTFKNNTYYNISLKPDIEILGYSMRRLKAKNFRHVTTERYTTVDDIIILSKTLPYSQFEKIFIPFDDIVWFCLISTMSAALFIILFLKLTPRTVQNFVFGNKVTTPLLNMMQVILMK